MTVHSVFRRLLLAAVSLTFTVQALAAEKVTLQLKWLPQAQFAGYYVAQAKGYYKDEGLDVTIKPGGTDISPVQVIAGKSADVIVDWMPDALAAREAGVPLVNIAQIFDRSGMMLTCRKSSGVTTPADLKGKTLGVWFGGNEYPFFNWMNKLGYKPGVDINVLKQGFNVDPLLQNQAACISTMNYNEYWQLIDAGMKKEDLVTFPYEDEGVSTLEDGLYVLGPNLKDKAFVAKMAKFLKASYKGWNEAVNHPEEAAKIVVSEDASGSATVAVQQRQMENVAKLITNANTPKIGYLDPAAYRRTVDVLLNSGGGSPVIKKDPGDSAMSHVVWDAAAK
ncbi:ABC transporter substrate-binding protein [Pectobacteriaceae bacterium C52]|uniref:Thiamine pyrimidine synthase n=1 Tax=Serratia sp. (strain ATCC 39006) TaxID=104623 RepID=A0A2I5T241_SERS3|nr:ABC transporter substrate-binding protein [Serratia sp. ATCC 39006]AUG98629.1 ABC transporter substrate-binding protein [Serratia sp. ATCC 39006]AUH02944.1 ABC transporter substrate-binding protein [Serratia sp. ATCC 39006]WJV62702.1 ABC transporter substrate-binding protein [Pectobacteriaceae bacterium C52]WJY14941.1 ABC transporter substrate-binding protein [Pectobacteriaceae bacterium CE90]